MDNPLELPVPDDPIERIHSFAKILAYGAAKDWWGSRLSILYGHYQWNETQATILSDWDQNFPSPYLLVSFGYLIPDGAPDTPRESVPIHEAIGSSSRGFFLTTQAFALLESPDTLPSVFISYKRGESSALGLLIEARLKRANSGINIFIDKELEPGDKWHGRLEAEVRQRPYFICLLGPTSLGSRCVRKEIQWALDESEKSGTLVIPICHNGYSFDADLHPDLAPDTDEINARVAELGVNNAIPVFPESADEYEQAMIRLLNRLGYSTI